MTLNPMTLAAKAFYALFKATILTAWQAAKNDAFAEIRASLPTDADLNEIRLAIPAPQTEADEPTEAEADKPKRKK